MKCRKTTTVEEACVCNTTAQAWKRTGAWSSPARVWRWVAPPNRRCGQTTRCAECATSHCLKSDSEIAVQRGWRGSQFGGRPRHGHEPLFEHDDPICMRQDGPE